MRKLEIIVLSLLIIQVLGNTLSVLEGQTNVTTKEMQFSIADFGDIPYGQSVIGVVKQANPFDACTKIDQVNTTEISPTMIPIVLIQRGGPGGEPSPNCHFVDKVKNAENAGYKIAIIEDNIEEGGIIIMADDGRGHQIHIPSIFISRQNGQTLLKDVKNSQNKLVYVRIFFEIQQKETSEYTFLIQPNDRLTQSFLLQFNEYRKAFDNQTEFNLKYNFYRCEGCIQNQSASHTNCLGGGRYCLIDPDGPYQLGNGRMSGYEAIRQICIYEKYGISTWYQYIKNFYRYCPIERSVEWEVCSAKEQELISEIDPQVIQNCFFESFNKSSANKQELQTNYLIEKYMPNPYEMMYVSQDRMTIKINNLTYFGKFNPYDVAEAICSSLINPSDLCKKIIDGLVIKSAATISNEELLKRQGMSVTSIVLITVSILVVIFVIILVIYKKLVGREMKTEMDTQVNEMVANYIKFYEQKDKSKSDMA